MAKKSFLLRMPPDLWEDMNRWAQDELRSVNGQIEYLLRQAVNRRRGQREVVVEPTDEPTTNKEDHS
jgi:hypothetical protein